MTIITNRSAFNSPVIDIYLDGANGADSNSGYLGFPLQTFAALYSKFPTDAIGTGEIRVHLSDDGYGGLQTYEATTLLLGGGHPNRAGYSYIGPQMIPVIPEKGSASAELAKPAAEIVNELGRKTKNGQRTKLIVSGGNWSENDFAKQTAFVRITRGGLLVVPEIPISRNGKSELFVDDQKVADDVMPGDKVEIVMPGARIIGSPPYDQSPKWFRPVSVRGIGSGGDAHATWFGRANLCAFTRIDFEFLVSANCWDLTFDRCRWNRAQAFILGGSAHYINCGGDASISHAAGAMSQPHSSGNFLGKAKGVCLCLVGTGVGYAQLSVGMLTDTAAAPTLGGQLTPGANICVWDSWASWGAIHVAGPGSILNMAKQTALVGDKNRHNALVVVAGATARINGGDYARINGRGKDLRLRRNGPSVDLGNGAGMFEDTAGYDGHFQDFPKKPGDKGDQSIITTQEVF